MIKNLVTYFAERSLIVNMLSIGLVIAGIVFITSANREAFPRVEYNWVLCTTIYPGATALDIEKHITIPIEDQLREVEDIEEIHSGSLESRSVVAVKLDPDVDNKDKTITDIKDAIDMISDFPEEAEDPTVIELSTALAPVIEISVTPKEEIKNDDDERELRRHAKLMEDKIRELDGVARIDRQGYRDREMVVEVDPSLLEYYHIGVNEIIRALSNKNLNFPAGVLRTDKEEIMVRTLGEVENTLDIRNVLVRANDLGNWVRVGDVATVKDSFEEEEVYSRTAGKKSITLTVLKKESADIINVVNLIENEVSVFQKRYGDKYNFATSNDLSYFVKRRLRVLMGNGLTGMVLVLISLLITLGWRISLVTAMGIPLALCGTFIWMGMAGVTINLMSMFGMIMVLGMLVDDAIVVAENIYRHMEEGEPIKQAVINGTAEVIAPVAGTIMTTVAAFAPLLFMSGISGKFIWALPAVVSVALISSWVESVFILPSHIHDIEQNARARHSKIKDREESFYKKIQDAYSKILSVVLTHKYKFSLLIAVLFFGSLLFATTNIKFILFPQGAIERFIIKIEASKTTTLKMMSKKVSYLEGIVAKLPTSEMDNFISYTGMTREHAMDPNEKIGSNYGTIIVNLTPEEERERTASQIMDWVRDQARAYDKEFIKVEYSFVKSGPPVGKAVNVTIKGDEFEELQKIAEIYKAYLKKIPGLKDVKDSFEEGKKEERIIVNEKTASIAGISVYDIATTVRTCFKGTVATKIKKSDEEIEIRVIFPEHLRNNLATLKKVKISNMQGNLIPLTSVASFTEGYGISVVQRKDWKRAIEVTAEIDEHAKDVTSVSVNQKMIKDFSDIETRYQGVLVDYEGEYKDTQQSFGDLGRSFIIAFIVIYIILVIIFRSLSHPFIIVNVIPLSFIGVIWAVYFHNMPLSFLALMGVVGLAGVVVNDSIVLVDFIRSERRRGFQPFEACISACSKRLRPVFLTTITTFFGLIPTAYGIGGNDPFLKPMAISLAWGLTFGTCITLFATPILYNIFSDIKIKLFKKTKDSDGSFIADGAPETEAVQEKPDYSEKKADKKIRSFQTNKSSVKNTKKKAGPKQK